LNLSFSDSDVIEDDDETKDMGPENKDLQKQQRQEQGQGQELGTEAKNIQTPLLQRHIIINWGEFSKIVRIQNVISSVILLKYSPTMQKSIR